jgi:predicted protein tyrosine phosphatase
MPMPSSVCFAGLIRCPKAKNATSNAVLAMEKNPTRQQFHPAADNQPLSSIDIHHPHHFMDPELIQLLGLHVNGILALTKGQTWQQLG